MKKRIFAAVLACALLTGCGPVVLEDGGQTAERITVAYVPLDDRPDNLERAVYLAESLGYTLAMPETDDYRTRLQDQPLNENGTQYGDRADLYEWVLNQEEAGCDRYILSMDQLLSGGLVNSRSMWESEPVTLSDGTTLTEAELLDHLLTTLAEDKNNEVWLLESVMRLAPTVGYDHWDLDGYNALRSYGMVGRPVLTGDELTISNIEADYRLASDGTVLALPEFDLEEWEVSEYLAARTRKLTLSDQMLETVSQPGYENFHVLIGIDDSSVEDSIQKNEIAYLRSLLREGDALLSGVDDLAFKAIARLYLDETGWQGAAVSVEYFGGTEDQPACDYDYQPLTTIMEEHFDFFGLTAADPGAAELRVLVLTQPADETQKDTYIQALIQELDGDAAQVPAILIDAGNGTYGTAFHEALTEKVQLGKLLSYAGFLDMAIVTGTALSHGVARYAALQNGGVDTGMNRAWALTLADSVLKDFCYKNVVREDLIAYVRNDLGGNPDNFWQPAIDLEAVTARLESGMEDATADVIENLEHSNFITALPSAQEYAQQGWGTVTLSNYRFPWDRAFEISMDITLGAFTEPHEKILGFYYK